MLSDAAPDLIMNKVGKKFQFHSQFGATWCRFCVENQPNYTGLRSTRHDVFRISILNTGSKKIIIKGMTPANTKREKK